jgi:hypothetical protein
VTLIRDAAPSCSLFRHAELARRARELSQKRSGLKCVARLIFAVFRR